MDALRQTTHTHRHTRRQQHRRRQDSRQWENPRTWPMLHQGITGPVQPGRTAPPSPRPPPRPRPQRAALMSCGRPPSSSSFSSLPRLAASLLLMLSSPALPAAAAASPPPPPSCISGSLLSGCDESSRQREGGAPLCVRVPLWRCQPIRLPLFYPSPTM